MQAIKLITFDATNTLLKFRIPAWQYYCVVGRDYGFTGTEETLKVQMKESFKKMNAKHPNFGKSNITWETWWTELVKQTFQDQLPANSNIDAIAHKLIDEFKTAKCWSVSDGSQKLLNSLRRKDVCLGVISNFDPRLHDILRNVRLHNNFDFILTSYEVGYSKPDKLIFNHAIKASNKLVEPVHCLHVGDDLEKDYTGAREAGWHALLVGSTNRIAAKEHVFESIEQLSLAIENNKVEL